MVVESMSATEPARVQVEQRGAVCDVWLRDNVVQDVAEAASGEDVATCDVWRYNEVHYVADGSPTAEEVEAGFDELWAAHEHDGETDAQRVERLAETAQAQADYTAVMTGTVLE